MMLPGGDMRRGQPMYDPISPSGSPQSQPVRAPFPVAFPGAVGSALSAALMKWRAQQQPGATPPATPMPTMAPQNSFLRSLAGHVAGGPLADYGAYPDSGPNTAIYNSYPDAGAGGTSAQTPGVIAAMQTQLQHRSGVNPLLSAATGLIGGPILHNLFKKNNTPLQDIRQGLEAGNTISDASWKMAGFGPGGSALT